MSLSSDQQVPVFKMEAANSVDPSYLTFIIKSYHFFANTFNQVYSGKYGRAQLGEDLVLLGRQVSLLDLFMVTVLSVLFTLARHYSTKFIFKVKF